MTANDIHVKQKQRNDEKIQKFSPRIRQFYAALGPTLITISLGMAEGYSAVLLPQLENEKTMDIDDEMESWIASIAALPMPLGCILGGILMEIIGRKTIHMACCVPCLIGWIIMYFSTTPTLLLIARFITGFCVGLLGPPTSVYMAETSEPEFRGFLLALISFAIALGIVLSHSLGTYLTWQTVALICCIFPIACLVIMTFAPESPTFLAKKGKTERAKKAFYWCRGHDDRSEMELKILIERQSIISNQPKRKAMDYLKDLKKPEFVKPLMIMLIFFLTVQWSGSNAVTFYNVMIVKKTVGGHIDEYLGMLIMDIVRLVTSILACYLLKKMGRRPLAILSCGGTFASLAILSVFIYCSRFYPFLMEIYYMVPLAALVAYMGFLTIGLVPLPWTMTGEVFPLANRGLGSGISALVNYAFIFSVVKTTPAMFANLGVDGAFLVYGVVCLSGLVVLAMFLPETKDKPLHEIEDYFKGKK